MLTKPAPQQEGFERSSAGFSRTLRVKIENRPGNFAEIVKQVALLGGSLSQVDLIYSDFNYTIRQITINCKSESHGAQVLEKLGEIKAASILLWQDDTFEMHRGGKLFVVASRELKTTDELSRAYTPGVARVCTTIHQKPETVYDYTIKSHTVAVVTDGSAVLGLGNIGPSAALPVMEGKAMLFKQFAGIDAFPICLATQDTEEIIRTVQNIAPVFGGVNLEDISAPRCFEIEERLQATLDIPVFHDDQHGTAIVVLAGLLNALKIVGKDISKIKVVVNGFGAGGVACTKMLLQGGVKNIIACDTAGTVYRGRKDRMNPMKEELVKRTNPENLQGSVADALKGADVFIGVSKPGSITRLMVQAMAKDPIVFALANPTPEIMPDEIKDVARIIATGRSDYANQVNNVLCFPGIFRGALECRARTITDAMKVAAARAIAEAVGSDELRDDYIIPSIFRNDIAGIVAKRVVEAAR